MTLSIIPAVNADIADLHPVIERAYRGDAARTGWTHEADLLEGERTDPDTLVAILRDPASQLLIARDGDRVIGCVQITDKGDGLAYLGLLCIDPVLQAGGLGKQLIAAAERHASATFGATAMEMTVIQQRLELIAYYERRGYAATGEIRDFPIVLTPPFFLTVLSKPLEQDSA